MTGRAGSARRRVVVVPTYNEVDSLEVLVAGIRACGFAVCVVDDASPDGTGALATDLATRHDDVHVLRRPGKAGLGSAYRDGFAWALRTGFSVVGQMDADGSHDPADLPRLAVTLAGCDVAIGSRWVPGGGAADWPAWRQRLSRWGNAYVAAATGLPVADATAGFRLWRAEALRAIDVTGLASDGYSFQVETTLAAQRAARRIMEVPITFRERRAGVSKLSAGIVVEALLRVTAWGLRKRLGR